MSPIAAVASHYRLNANLLRPWVNAREKLDSVAEAREALALPSAEFVPLQLCSPRPKGESPDIVTDLRCGATSVTLRWPASDAGECARWLQGWLR
ncbi:IS66 family insertion sequence hypothetical protein [Paraburkholderia caribensis]|nr:IS66 family insertion sequence hypothetical protein [Paraburkholderia caribensis]